MINAQGECLGHNQLISSEKGIRIKSDTGIGLYRVIMILSERLVKKLL